MKIKTLVSSLRKWVSDLPIQDPLDRQMAALIQVILLGFIAMIFIAGFLNLAIPPFLSWQLVLIQSFVSILLISIPLGLLRGGYFQTSVSIVIALFITFETYAVLTRGLLGSVGTLPFFTLALILAALMLDRRALLLTFTQGFFGLLALGDIARDTQDVFYPLCQPKFRDQPGFEMGQEAAKLLIRQIEFKSKDNQDPTPETKILKTRLIVRDSSLKKGKVIKK